MKKLQFIPITLMLMLVLSCNKEEPKPAAPAVTPAVTEKSEENAQDDTRYEESSQEIEADVPDVNDDKVILEISTQSYTNKDLKAFLRRRYSAESIAEMRNSPRVMSRVFDTFVDDNMVLFMVNKEDIQLTEGELETYLKDKQMNGDKTEETAIIDAARIHKYLFLSVYKDVDVSDAEVRAYFQKNIDRYRKDEEVLLHQIVVKESSKADDIRRQLIKNPQQFATIAAKESQSRERAEGGCMGYFSKGILPKDMEDVVFSLENDDISPVVKSPYGFHIFKVTKKKGKRLVGIDVVEPEIKNAILSEKMNGAFQNFLAQLKKQLTVKTRYTNLFFTYQAVKKGD